jgi:ATP-binding cassette, subfamily B (MDR/TAP), member 1
MDADCIYVMGNGVVLERGKHDELLSNEDGAYARLVGAQRLREARETVDIPVGQSSEKAVEKMDVEKVALEEVPLGRSKTHRSLASEIIEQRNVQGFSKHEKQYSTFYLLRRMGRINKGEWKSYVFGCLFSIGKYIPCSDNRRLTIGSQQLDPSFRLSVLFGVRPT